MWSCKHSASDTKQGIQCQIVNPSTSPASSCGLVARMSLLAGHDAFDKYL